MQINVLKTNLEESQFPLTVIGFTEESVKNPGKLLKKTIDTIVELGDFKGEKGTSSLIYPEELKNPRILLVGLGKESDAILETIRGVVGSVSRVVRETGVKKAGLYLPSFKVGSLKTDEISAPAYACNHFNNFY
jgi:leucyl aminopeptidase